MGIDIWFFATPPGDLRAWALDRLPRWWSAWTGAMPPRAFPPPESDAWHRTDTFDQLAALVDRVRPLGPHGSGGSFFDIDRPTRPVFGRALRLLRSGAAAWEARRPAEAAVMDGLIWHLLRDTDYHLRFPREGDPVAAALAPIGAAPLLGGGVVPRHSHIPQTRRLPRRATPALHARWDTLFTGRTVAVVKPEHAGAWGDRPVDACTPDDMGFFFGWFSEDECAALRADLAAIEGDALEPMPASDRELRWLAGLKETQGEAVWAQERARLEARGRDFIPYEHALGLHVVRDAVTEAGALGCGLGFFVH